METGKENKKLKSNKADAQELLEARDENNRLEARIRELERSKEVQGAGTRIKELEEELV